SCAYTSTLVSTNSSSGSSVMKLFPTPSPASLGAQVERTLQERKMPPPRPLVGVVVRNDLLQSLDHHAGNGRPPLSGHHLDAPDDVLGQGKGQVLSGQQSPHVKQCTTCLRGGDGGRLSETARGSLGFQLRGQLQAAHVLEERH